MNYLVTGCTGFVGRHLIKSLLQQPDTNVLGVGRHQTNSLNVNFIKIYDLNGTTDWSEALTNIDVVIHLAARVHVMKELSADPLSEFRKVNVEGTRQLALQAANVGVKRMVYVSSIKVNGEKTMDKPFNECDPAAPQDAYGISKYEAELALKKIADNSGLEIVIVRPPLIYGPGVKGNFLQLYRAVTKGLPLPFSSIKNSRSFLYVGNLVDALILCATHPKAAGKTYLISDGQDVSTPNLVKALTDVLGLKDRLFHCPTSILKCLGIVTGRKDQMDRLLDSLQVYNCKLTHDLGWEPKFGLHEGLRNTFETGFN